MTSQQQVDEPVRAPPRHRLRRQLRHVTEEGRRHVIVVREGGGEFAGVEAARGPAGGGASEQTGAHAQVGAGLNLFSLILKICNW